MQLHIVYEDRHLLVLYKPAGVPVQSGKIGAADCVSMLKNYLSEQRGVSGDPYVGVVHRLDQPVEGLVVFALTPKAAAELSRQAAGPEMHKNYLAICRPAGDKSVDNGEQWAKLCGKPHENVDNLVENWTRREDYLVKKPREGRAERVLAQTPGARRAVLFYRVLELQKDLGLLEIRLETGRFHQIRVQMAGMSYPLLGDRKYGNVDNYVDNVDNSPLALCAWKLEFTHPITGKPLIFRHFPTNPAFGRFHHFPEN